MCSSCFLAVRASRAAKGPRELKAPRLRRLTEFLCLYEGCKSGVSGNGFCHVEYLNAHVQNYHVGLPEPTSLRHTDGLPSSEPQILDRESAPKLISSRIGFSPMAQLTAEDFAPGPNAIEPPSSPPKRGISHLRNIQPRNYPVSRCALCPVVQLSTQDSMHRWRVDGRIRSFCHSCLSIPSNLLFMRRVAEATVCPVCDTRTQLSWAFGRNHICSSCFTLVDKLRTQVQETTYLGTTQPQKLTWPPFPKSTMSEGVEHVYGNTMTSITDPPTVTSWSSKVIGAESPSWPGPAADELPFTDSGYASMVHGRTDPKLSRWTPPREQGRDDEIGTIYSAVTSVDVFHARDYVQELCRDIRAKIQDHIRQDDWPNLELILPQLIKTFALKLGEGASSLDERRIMRFLHKRHRYGALTTAWKARLT
jgi:hypothetical protein